MKTLWILRNVAGWAGGWVVHEVFVLLGVTAVLVAILATLVVDARACTA